MEIVNLGKADGLPPVDWASVAEKLSADSARDPASSFGDTYETEAVVTDEPEEQRGVEADVDTVRKVSRRRVNATRRAATSRRGTDTPVPSARRLTRGARCRWIGQHQRSSLRQR